MKINPDGLSWLTLVSACVCVLSGCQQQQTPEALLPGLQMVDIPAGTYQMGLAGDDKAEPVHAVNIKAFKLATHEVTVAQFRAFVDATAYKSTAEQGNGDSANGCRVYNSGTGRPGTRASGNWRDPAFPQTDQQPVVCISYYDMQAFITWLNKQTGRKFRLPSEAEWEYAAHAGSANAYYWGEARSEVCKYENTSDSTPDPLATVASDATTSANVSAAARRSDISPADVGVGGPAIRAGMAAATESAAAPPPVNGVAAQRCSDGYFYTSPVGSYAANAFGLYDMLGNVRERVADCWHENYQGAPSDGSVWSTACSKPEYVARGGSWTFQVATTAGNRGNTEAAGSNDNLGFRLAEDM